MALTEAQKKQKAKHIKYWRDREEEQLKHNITDEKEYEAELKRIYENMLDACQKEIDAFYGRYAKQNNITLAEAKKAVSELDIKAYERKAKRYVKDKDFSKEANEEMRLYNLTMKVNRLEMLKASIGLELIAGHDELQKFMGKILQGRTEDELKRQAGILGKTIKNNAQTANAIVNASFHNATFSDRVWTYQDLLKNELGNLLQSGLIAGKNPRVLAADIKKRFDVKTSDAERLMRTELARVQTEAQKQSFERNGFTMYTFIANGNCCPICENINGEHFKVADMLPGKNAAPMHPFVGALLQLMRTIKSTKNGLII
jgi:SPP1 gp7 family putative phage head morphogenesis protein